MGCTRQGSFDETRRSHQFAFHLVEMPLTNLPLSWVENFLAMSTASLMLTIGGCPRDRAFRKWRGAGCFVHGRHAVQVPVACVFLDLLSSARDCSMVPRIERSANKRTAASSTVGGGSSTVSPQRVTAFSSLSAAARL